MSSPNKSKKKASGMGIYEELGVRPVINAWGTVTRIGGSRMDVRVLEAMEEASRAFVDMEVLHAKAGERVADLLGAEAACITSGAAAGLAIAAAACMAQDDPARILALPDSRGMRNEVLVLKAHRILYDQGLRLSGAQFVEIGVTSSATIAQVIAAVTDRTSMFFYAAEASQMRGSLPLAEIARVMNPLGIPIIVDAAAELPPVKNLTSFFTDGADLVVFSGGKELRGPQSSGLILGSRKLINYCRANCFPNYSVGRSMKTDKETIVGLVKAVELFIERDYEVIYAEWERMVETVLDGVSHVKHLEARRGFPTQPGIQPADIPRAYLHSKDISAAELQLRLRNGSPSVAVSVEDDEIALNPQCLSEKELPVLIAAVISVLS